MHTGITLGGGSLADASLITADHARTRNAPKCALDARNPRLEVCNQSDGRAVDCVVVHNVAGWLQYRSQTMRRRS